MKSPEPPILKPCPFCGVPPVLGVNESWNPPLRIIRAVCENGCPCSLWVERDSEDAREKWNNRATPSLNMDDLYALSQHRAECGYSSPDLATTCDPRCGQRYGDLTFWCSDACVNKLRPSEISVVAALTELVRLKDYKDEHGKDLHYNASQKGAWMMAKAALASVHKPVSVDLDDVTLWKEHKTRQQSDISHYEYRKIFRQILDAAGLKHAE